MVAVHVLCQITGFHNISISNNLIIKLENDRVTFKWRDYKDNTKLRLCQKLTGGRLKPLDKKRLSAAEIILKISGRDITKCPCCGCSKQQNRYNQMYSNAPPVMPLSK